MSIKLLDKTRKIGRLLHENKSDVVLFNDICKLLGGLLSANVMVISTRGKLLGIFEDDKNDPVIRFSDSDLSVRNCTVDGKETLFSDDIDSLGIDSKMPLVADHNGSYINTSIKSVENGTVSFYAPVFKDIEYRFAKKVEDYEGEFRKKTEEEKDRKPFFSCNCILNYNYGNLSGKKMDPFTGPVTFGEVAYQLINQTLVYCEILG